MAINDVIKEIETIFLNVSFSDDEVIEKIQDTLDRNKEAVDQDIRAILSYHLINRWYEKLEKDCASLEGTGPDVLEPLAALWNIELKHQKKVVFP